NIGADVRAVDGVAIDVGADQVDLLTWVGAARPSPGVVDGALERDALRTGQSRVEEGVTRRHRNRHRLVRRARGEAEVMVEKLAPGPDVVAVPNRAEDGQRLVEERIANDARARPSGAAHRRDTVAVMRPT